MRTTLIIIYNLLIALNGLTQTASEYTSVEIKHCYNIVSETTQSVQIRKDTSIVDNKVLTGKNIKTASAIILNLNLDSLKNMELCFDDGCITIFNFYRNGNNVLKSSITADENKSLSLIMNTLNNYVLKYLLTEEKFEVECCLCD